jgi:hypothetical protein
MARKGLLRDKYTFFVSYRWNRFSDEAQRLCSSARHHGHATLIDHDWIVDRDERFSKTQIEKQLRWAIHASQYILFFETATKLAQAVGGHTDRCEGWQEAELKMAAKKRVIVLYHEGPHRYLSYGLNTDFHPYTDLDDAWKLIARVFEDKTLFDPKPSGDGPAQAERHSPQLQSEEASLKISGNNECLEKLAQQHTQTEHTKKSAQS